VLVHAPSQEKMFLEQGYGVSRKILAYNFFTVVGPQADPAGISGMNVTDALKEIVAFGRNQTGRVWISRGDNSGTHTKEQSLWSLAGFNYSLISTESWYASAGSGMGETLLKAEQFSAYTLSDIGTYLKYFEKDHIISLNSFIAERQELLNVYSVIAVNQTLHEHTNFDDAVTFIEFLISDECQSLIENYGEVDYGQSGRLFHGAVQMLKQNSTDQIAQWIRSYAYFDGSECPQQYRDSRHPELYG
jgi:tungstate transport system substrate-binding protein